MKEITGNSRRQIQECKTYLQHSGITVQPFPLRRSSAKQKHVNMRVILSAEVLSPDQHAFTIQSCAPSSDNLITKVPKTRRAKRVCRGSREVQQMSKLVSRIQNRTDTHQNTPRRVLLTLAQWLFLEVLSSALHMNWTKQSTIGFARNEQIRRIRPPCDCSDTCA